MDEKSFDLRDKLAIEVLNGLIAGKSDTSLYTDILYYLTSDEKDTSGYSEAACRRVERVVRNCYKVADIMRKVRLSTFE